MAICVAGAVGSAFAKDPPWLVVLFAVLTAMTALSYLFAYIYCLFTDKEALRSETYSIQKLAIEKGFVVGVQRLPTTPNRDSELPARFRAMGFRLVALDRECLAAGRYQWDIYSRSDSGRGKGFLSLGNRAGDGVPA